MKNKGLWIASLALMMAMPMQAQKFEDNFEDKTQIGRASCRERV